MTYANWTDSSETAHNADPVVAALAEMVVALEANAHRATTAVERARDVCRLLENGERLAEVLSGPGVSVIEAVNENLRALTLGGGRLRRVGAQALYQDGMTMDEIGKLFGVSRQRVAALLQSPAQMQGPPWTRRGIS